MPLRCVLFHKRPLRSVVREENRRALLKIAEAWIALAQVAEGKKPPAGER
jgi:hypothetical protein